MNPSARLYLPSAAPRLAMCDATSDHGPCIRPQPHTVGPNMADNGHRWDDDLFTTTGTTHTERQPA